MGFAELFLIGVGLSMDTAKTALEKMMYGGTPSCRARRVRSALSAESNP